MIATASKTALRTPKSQRFQSSGRAQAHTQTGHFLCARLSHGSIRALFHKAFSFVASSFCCTSPVRAVTQASLSVCSGVHFGAAVETGLFSGLHGLRCLHPWQLHPHPALGRTRGVRGRVLPCVGTVLEHGRRSKQKGRREERQPIGISYHFLLNLSTRLRSLSCKQCLHFRAGAL